MSAAVEQQVMAANELARGYADQNARFAAMIHEMAGLNAHYYGLANSLLASSSRLLESSNPDASRAELSAVVGAVRAELANVPKPMRGAMAIAAERARQVAAGHTVTSDALQMTPTRTLTLAGHCYIKQAMTQLLYPGMKIDESPPFGWPWAPDAWKPGDFFANIAKGCALFAAAYDQQHARERGFSA